MNTKFFLKIGIALGLLVVLFVAAQVVYSSFGLAPERGSASSPGANSSSPDWVERHSADLGMNVSSSPDWVERHSPALAGADKPSGKDWIDRKLSNSYGSDWIERRRR